MKLRAVLRYLSSVVMWGIILYIAWYIRLNASNCSLYVGAAGNISTLNLHSYTYALSNGQGQVCDYLISCSGVEVLSIAPTGSCIEDNNITDFKLSNRPKGALCS